MNLVFLQLGGAQVLDRGQLAREEINGFGVPLRARPRAKNRDGLRRRAPHAVRPVVDQGVKGVADGDDAGSARDLACTQPVWISAAVEALVMVADDRQQTRWRLQRLDDALADGDMCLHLGNLDRIQWSRPWDE